VCFGSFFRRLFSSRFQAVFRSVFLCNLSGNGCPWGPFWETFGDFLEVRGPLLDATHSQAKTYIFNFWRFQVGTFSSTFPGPDFCVRFYRFLCGLLRFWCDLGSPLGPLLALFGSPFRARLAIRFRTGEKVVSGWRKSHF